jgi:multidrug resistance efflux pump
LCLKQKQKGIKMKKNIGKVVVVLVVIASCFISANLMAEPGMGALPKGVTQVWSAFEGNITYYVKAGEKVKKGTPLFFVQRNDVPPQASHLVKLENEVNYCKRTYDRNKSLIKSHSVSEQAYDDSQNAYNDAMGELADYKAQMKECFYTAPFDCEITKLLYLSGSGVGDGNPMINIKEIPASELK